MMPFHRIRHHMKMIFFKTPKFRRLNRICKCTCENWKAIVLSEGIGIYCAETSATAGKSLTGWRCPIQKLR